MRNDGSALGRVRGCFVYSAVGSNGFEFRSRAKGKGGGGEGVVGGNWDRGPGLGAPAVRLLVGPLYRMILFQSEMMAGIIYVTYL